MVAIYHFLTARVAEDWQIVHPVLATDHNITERRTIETYNRESGCIV